MSSIVPLDKELISRKGLALKDSNEIQVSPEGCLVYKGRIVLVYIRDQTFNPDEPKREYKYHVADCDTLKNMKRNNRYGRYVLSRRTDGVFLVNIRNKKTNRYVERDVFKKMNVCKNCLLALKYKGYENHSIGRGTYDAFDLKEFFLVYKPEFEDEPKHDEKTAPINEYPENWQSISWQVREVDKWECQQPKCPWRAESAEDRKYLDVHHKDGIRTHNELSNLMSLCVKCHAEQEGHEDLKKSRKIR